MPEELPEPTDPAAGDTEIEPAGPSETGAKDQMGTGLFVILAIAIAAIVGAGVYVAGEASKRADETADAQQRSDQIIDDNDVDVTDFLDPGDSIPLVDDTDPNGSTTTTTAAPDSTDSVPDTTVDPRTVNGEGRHPEVLLDPETIAVTFVNRAPGEDYGKVGVMTFDGQRIITELRCSRIDINAFRGLCLAGPSEIQLSGVGLILDPQLVPTSKFDVNDPSRAVVSPDGTLVAWTGFTSGHSYAEIGEFSTITQLIAVDRQIGVNLETDFTTVVEGEESEAPDRNFWGVTFADNETFYATMQSGQNIWIVEGSTSTARINTKFADASCPELSPDGTTIVAKEQRGDRFQLVAIDVETGARRDLGETRSVDDQIEWLDNDSILYGIVNEDEGTEAQPAWDVYVLDTAPGASPQLLIPFADSPAVR